MAIPKNSDKSDSPTVKSKPLKPAEESTKKDLKPVDLSVKKRRCTVTDECEVEDKDKAGIKGDDVAELCVDTACVEQEQPDEEVKEKVKARKDSSVDPVSVEPEQPKEDEGCEVKKVVHALVYPKEPKDVSFPAGQRGSDSESVSGSVTQGSTASERIQRDSEENIIPAKNILIHYYSLVIDVVACIIALILILLATGEIIILFVNATPTVLLVLFIQKKSKQIVVLYFDYKEKQLSVPKKENQPPAWANAKVKTTTPKYVDSILLKLCGNIFLSKKEEIFNSLAGCHPHYRLFQPEKLNVTCLPLTLDSWDHSYPRRQPFRVIGHDVDELQFFINTICDMKKYHKQADRLYGVLLTQNLCMEDLDEDITARDTRGILRDMLGLKHDLCGKFGRIRILKDRTGKLYAEKTIKIKHFNRNELEVPCHLNLSPSSSCEIPDCIPTIHAISVYKDEVKILISYVGMDWMEWMMMNRCDQGCTPDKMNDIKVYLEQALKTLGVMAGKGIAHGDIKLENLGLQEGMLKLLDWGSCCKATDNATGGGTPGYLPPEQYTQFHERRPSGKADMFALGLCVVSLLAGREHRYLSQDLTPELALYFTQRQMIQVRCYAEIVSRIPDAYRTQFGGIISAMTEFNPDLRATPDQALLMLSQPPVPAAAPLIPVMVEQLSRRGT